LHGGGGEVSRRTRREVREGILSWAQAVPRGTVSRWTRSGSSVTRRFQGVPLRERQLLDGTSGRVRFVSAERADRDTGWQQCGERFRWPTRASRSGSNSRWRQVTDGREWRARGAGAGPIVSAVGAAEREPGREKRPGRRFTREPFAGNPPPGRAWETPRGGFWIRQRGFGRVPGAGSTNPMGVSG
jgi:hypothetical protein